MRIVQEQPDTTPNTKRAIGVVGDLPPASSTASQRSEEHTSELQSPCNLVCRLLLEKKKKTKNTSNNGIQTSTLQEKIRLIFCCPMRNMHIRKIRHMVTQWHGDLVDSLFLGTFSPTS